MIGAQLAAARPRVVAALSRSFRSLDLAEDGFQEASLRALDRWPQQGTPRDPTAWLIRTGRNLTIDRLRKYGRETELPGDLAQWRASDDEARLAEAIDRGEMRDDVLRLLFLCCHDELPPQDQLALALKVVAGFSVDEIARAFLVRPKAMEQRITRAKKKAAATLKGLETPSRTERLERLQAVSTMVYLLFNEGYAARGGDRHLRLEVAEEAVRLARLLVELFPGQPEQLGLLALCLLHHSRRQARLDDQEHLIPLDQQDRFSWDRAMIDEGRILIEKALRKGSPGPFQIQAAIAALHCAAETTEETDWLQIDLLYRALEEMQPSPVVSLNRAVVVSKVEGPQAALRLLDPLAGPLDHYLYYHSTRGALLADLAHESEAATAYRRALELGPSRPERSYLESRLRELEDR